jgi:4-hydroxy-tetrahydrodipicolinate reductase
MGQEVERLALARGHKVTARFDIKNPLDKASRLEAPEVLVEFSVPDAVLPNLRWAAARRIPVIEGTTGWYADLAEARAIPGLTMVYSPNFSPGVFVFMELVRTAARQLSSVEGYDSYVNEWHHSGKLDSPSGTARKLGEILVEELPDKERALYDICNRRIESDEIHIGSIRAGRIPGTHEVGFDSAFDMIELRHTAHGREGFALGSILAAEWILGKEGVFTMEEFMLGFRNKKEKKDGS